MKVEKEKLEIDMKTTKTCGNTGKKWKELLYTKYGSRYGCPLAGATVLTISKNTDLPRR